MPPVKMRGDGRKAKNPKKTLLRLLSYMKGYIPILLLVLVCIIVTAIAQTTGSKSIGTLVDDYLLPMVASGSTDFAPVMQFLIRIGCIFAAGLIASFLNQFLMVSVSQGTQKKIRDQLFTKMQQTSLLLPVFRYLTESAVPSHRPTMKSSCLPIHPSLWNRFMNWPATVI